ncbi:hypothetical protein F0L74_05945 [Chitinophaga agrisoli]|uniref:Uncharacterized protein n=1 Tax=Chitinophaga agrisoli TaxID=2607653 RepID=A0A5B2W3R7_9BACT|nr:hypothetical protein [Chitinophaga agrisoli]KAA2245498.1 hypothetical protein F0L74_05945 [Chitinophaga agrisoli]
MKKLLILSAVSMLVAVAFECQAQVVNQVQRITASDTLTNADTAYLSFNSIGSHLKSIQVSVDKISGTVAGSVFIQATVDGFNWDSVTDTLTLANQANNKRTWFFTNTYYNSYRARSITSGTMQAKINAALLRRGDE